MRKLDHASEDRRFAAGIVSTHPARVEARRRTCEETCGVREVCSCGEAVFVDEAAETVAASNASADVVELERTGGVRGLLSRIGRILMAIAMK